MTRQTDTATPSEAYDGPADIVLGDRRIPVAVRLRGHFEPIDGRFHWWGRVDRCAELDDTARPGTTAVLATPHGTAEGRLSDIDPWGRFRISGTGRPPF